MTAAPQVKTVVAAALIRRRSGVPAEMLIARRTQPASVAGMWEFPGGKLEPGETLQQGVLRELDEELGVVGDIGEELTGAGERHIPEVGWKLKGDAVMRLFLGEITAGEPFPLQDHDRLDWAPLTDDLLDYPWIPADRPIVVELLRRFA